MRARVATVLLFLVAACQGEARVFTEQLHPVPHVTGESVPEARQALEAAGFGVAMALEGTDQITSDDGWCEEGTVTDQLPASDSEILTGATVTLFVSGCEADPVSEEAG